MRELIFALTVQVTRYARDFWLHLGKLSKLICTRFAQKFLTISHYSLRNSKSYYIGVVVEVML